MHRDATLAFLASGHLLGFAIFFEFAAAEGAIGTVCAFGAAIAFLVGVGIERSLLSLR